MVTSALQKPYLIPEIFLLQTIATCIMIASGKTWDNQISEAFIPKNLIQKCQPSLTQMLAMVELGDNWSLLAMKWFYDQENKQKNLSISL